MRAAVLAAILCLCSGAAMAQQTCTTRADGSFNCTTATPAAAVAPTVTAPGGKDRRSFQPDDSGLLRVPMQDGEMLYHCDSNGPCKQIGLNPLPMNR